jgi:hypothetical protein
MADKIVTLGIATFAVAASVTTIVHISAPATPAATAPTTVSQISPGAHNVASPQPDRFEVHGLSPSSNEATVWLVLAKSCDKVEREPNRQDFNVVGEDCELVPGVRGYADVALRGGPTRILITETYSDEATAVNQAAVIHKQLDQLYLRAEEMRSDAMERWRAGLLDAAGVATYADGRITLAMVRLGEDPAIQIDFRWRALSVAGKLGIWAASLDKETEPPLDLTVTRTDKEMSRWAFGGQVLEVQNDSLTDYVDCKVTINTHWSSGDHEFPSGEVTDVPVTLAFRNDVGKLLQADARINMLDITCRQGSWSGDFD